MSTELPVGINLGDSFDEDLDVVDAQAILAKAVVEGSAAVSNKAVEAAIFLELYLGPEGKQLVALAMAYKSRQAPGYVKRMVEAIKALSLQELIKPMSIGAGTGK